MGSAKRSKVCHCHSHISPLCADLQRPTTETSMASRRVPLCGVTLCRFYTALHVANLFKAVLALAWTYKVFPTSALSAWHLYHVKYGAYLLLIKSCMLLFQWARQFSEGHHQPGGSPSESLYGQRKKFYTKYLQIGWVCR